MGVVLFPAERHVAIHEQVRRDGASSPHSAPDGATQPWCRKLPPVLRGSEGPAAGIWSQPSIIGFDPLAMTVPQPRPAQCSQQRLCLPLTELWRPEAAAARGNVLRKRKASEAVATQSVVKRQRVAVACGRRAPVGTPRSLQFALPDLSSLDTLHLLHSMRILPSELRHLNSSNRLVHNKIHGVFGWRHMLWPEDDELTANRVVWKSAKALDSMSMGTLARQIWRRSRSGSSEERRQVLYQVNAKARVVRSTKRRRRGRDQIWLECFLDDGLQICVARKELRRFNEYRAPKTAAAECQGFLVRPVYAKASNARVMGCTLQCLRAVDARGGGVDAARTLKRRMVEDLPRFTLQWEEEHLYDLAPMPNVLLQTVFASRDKPELAAN